MNILILPLCLELAFKHTWKRGENMWDLINFWVYFWVFGVFLGFFLPFPLCWHIIIIDQTWVRYFLKSIRYKIPREKSILIQIQDTLELFYFANTRYKILYQRNFLKKVSWYKILFRQIFLSLKDSLPILSVNNILKLLLQAEILQTIKNKIF